MNNSEKKETSYWVRFIFLFVFICIAGGTVYMYSNENMTKGFMGFLTLILLIAIFIAQKYMRLPSFFVCFLYGFIFVAVGLGTFGGMYRLRHFDDFLHLISGVWLGYGGWLLLIYLTGEKLAEKLPRTFLFLYLFTFSLAGAGAWELLEFAGDKLFHFTAQGREHDDTMFDMLDGMIGGLVAAFLITKKR